MLNCLYHYCIKGAGSLLPDFFLILWAFFFFFTDCDPSETHFHLLHPYAEALNKICPIFPFLHQFRSFKYGITTHTQTEQLHRKNLKYPYSDQIASVSRSQFKMYCLEYGRIATDCFWNIGEIEIADLLPGAEDSGKGEPALLTKLKSRILELSGRSLLVRVHQQSY